MTHGEENEPRSNPFATDVSRRVGWVFFFCASLPLALLPISTESGVGFSRLLSLIPRESDSRGDHDGFLSKKEFFTRGNVLALSTVGRFAEMSEWLSGCVQDTARPSP